MAKTVSARADLLPLIAEVFRSHGYEGATLALIGKATGLGKGSLYHFFPGGKAQMAAEVLAEIDHWFEVNILRPAQVRRSGAGDCRHEMASTAISARAIASAWSASSRSARRGIFLPLRCRIISAAGTMRWRKCCAHRLQRERRAAALGGCAADHSGRAGAGAGARRLKSVRAGDGGYEGAAAGEVTSVSACPALRSANVRC